MSQTEYVSLDQAFNDQDKRWNYEKALDKLWLELIVENHERLKDAKVLLQTPIWLLTPGPSHILGRIAVTLLEHAALQTINVLTDETKGALTLDSLRILLLETCDPKLREDLAAEMAAGFESHRFDHLRDRAIRLRHKALAHLDSRHALEPKLQASMQLTVGDLEELLERAKGLLLVLSLGVGKGFDLHVLSPENDMRYVVVQLMRDSSWLRMPEDQDPAVLRAFAANWSEKEKHEFNHWRREIGRAAIRFRL